MLDWTDRVLELEVGAVAHGGHCVARHEGRVVFVRHALPGERVRAVVDEDTGGSFCRADAVAVLERLARAGARALRVGAGGRLRRVRPAARRAGRATAVEGRRCSPSSCTGSRASSATVEVEELPGGPLGWRSRVRLAVDEEGRAGLRAHRSHDVLPIADCPLAPPGTLAPVLTGRFAPGEVEVSVDALGAVHTGDDGPVVQRAAGREWRLSPGVFWQVHPALPDVLAQVVGEWAAAPRGGTAWDLYGGVGLFAAVLGRAGGARRLA